MNQNDGESCPGSETCFKNQGPGNLYKYPNTPEEDVCRGCPLYPTKPESTPDEIAHHVSLAAELSELSQSGAHFTYPDGLTPVEWSSLSGLTRGLARANALQRDREKKNQRREEAKKRFQNG